MKGTFQRRNGQLACHHKGKTAFTSKEDAESRLNEIRVSCKTTLRRAYRCQHCKHWHLTSDQNRHKRVKQREYLNDGLIPSKRVSVDEDTPRRQKQIESLWANYLGLK